MSKKIQFQIDGRVYTAAPDSTVLQVARENGIRITTLCNHEALEPAGSCRLCMVEITHRDWKGWKGLVTSCLYPVEEGLQVTTDTEEIREVRRTVLDLLLSRCPGSPELRQLAAEHGVAEPSFSPPEEETLCILCGLCVRVCAIKGCHAISTGGRGIERVIARPFGQPPPDCIGCASCAHICPTGHITCTDRGMVREIWGHTFPMVPCSSCGRPVMPEKQQAYEAAKSGLGAEYFATCADCSQKSTVDTIRTAFDRTAARSASPGQ